jgi:glycosyltransferase involved in cell wall biosynthesis
MSGVQTDLKAGLRALGVEADLATFGDHHKRFATDIRLGSTDAGFANSAGRIFWQLTNLLRFRKYDIVQSISPTPFNKAITRLMEAGVLDLRGPKYIYVSAASDSFYRNHVRSLEYYPPLDWYGDRRFEKLERRIAQRAAAIVTPLWDYSFTMQAAGFDPIFIPLPVDLAKIEQVPVGKRERISVYHPLNRYEGDDFKGTSHIRAAFAQLRAEFPNVDFVDRGGMSFADYSRFTQQMDVIVDQANSHSIGMSALYGLARGQVVLSGNEPRTHHLGHYAESPVINIRPDTDAIAGTLRSLLANPDHLAEIGDAGRLFAERVHSADLVARQYLALYERVLGTGQSSTNVQ